VYRTYLISEKSGNREREREKEMNVRRVKRCRLFPINCKPSVAHAREATTNDASDEVNSLPSEFLLLAALAAAATPTTPIDFSGEFPSSGASFFPFKQNARERHTFSHFFFYKQLPWNENIFCRYNKSGYIWLYLGYI
jgi:hypothetical protein